MSVLKGSGADVYIATGTGAVFTTEACSLVSGTTYQITDAAKRYWDPDTPVTVYDGGVPVDAGGYTVGYSSGKITFDVAPGGAVTVSGAYLTVSQWGQATEWEISAATELKDVTTFGTTAHTFQAGLGSGSARLKRFYNDAYFHSNLDGYFVLVLYSSLSGGSRFMAIGKLDTNQISTAAAEMLMENVSFITYGPIDFTAS